MNELPPLIQGGQSADVPPAPVVAPAPVTANAAGLLPGDGLNTSHAKGSALSQTVSLIPEHDTGAAALHAVGVTANNQGQVGDDQALEVIDNFLLNFSVLHGKSPEYDNLLALYEKWIGAEDALTPVEKQQLRLDIYKSFNRMTQSLAKLQLYDPKTGTYDEAFLPVLQEAMMNFSSTQKRILSDQDIGREPKLARLLNTLGCKNIAELQKKVGANVDGKFSYDTLFHAQAFALQNTAKGLQERASQELGKVVSKAKASLSGAQQLAKEYKETSANLLSDPSKLSEDHKKWLAEFDISVADGHVAIHGKVTSPEEALTHVKAHYDPLIQKARAEADRYLKTFDAEFAAQRDLLPADEALELEAFRKAAGDVEKEWLGQPTSGDQTPIHLVRKQVVRANLLKSPERLEAVAQSVMVGKPVSLEAAKDLDQMGITVETKPGGETTVKVNGEKVDQAEVAKTLDVAHRGVRGSGRRLWIYLAKASVSLHTMGVLITEKKALEAKILKAVQEPTKKPSESAKGKDVPAPAVQTADQPMASPSKKETAPLAPVAWPEEKPVAGAPPLFDALAVTRDAAQMRLEHRKRLEAHLDAKHEREKADYEEAAQAKADKQREATRLAKVVSKVVQQGDGQAIAVEQALAKDGSALGPEKASPELES